MAVLKNSRFGFLLVLLCVVSRGGLRVASAADDGTRYLDQREQEVKLLADAASANNDNCDLVSSCSLDCTRAVCNPRKQDGAMSICTKVENNEHCPQSEAVNNTCKQMMLNYNTSYLTLPAGADLAHIQPEVTRDICLQRALDETFKKISFPDSFSFVYFGSTSGAWRAYPGRDSSDLGCSRFEARQRPWYLDGISVLKHVKILVDTGNSMGIGVNGEFQRPPGTTYLDVAINISLAILQTLSPQDFVDVTSFNSSGAYSLGPPVNVGNYNQSIPAPFVSHPELEPLKQSVRGLRRSADPRPSNLVAAINRTAFSFQPTAIPSLKLILVITDGNFLPLNATTFPTAEIVAERVKLLVFKLPPNSDPDPFLLKTSLPTVLCGVKGSFELLEAPATANPLYSIRSYFSFLAKIHALAVANRPTWSNVYTSYSQARNAVTVTSPAFGKDGELIGVAGADVFLDELSSSLRALVIGDLASRSRGTLPAPDNTNLVCIYQNVTAVPPCISIALPMDGIICRKTDNKPLAERVCCGTCTVVDPPPSSVWWKVLVGCVAGVVGVLAVVGCWKKAWIREQIQIKRNGPHHNIPDNPPPEEPPTGHPLL